MEGEVIITVAVQLLDDSCAQNLIGRQARATLPDERTLQVFPDRLCGRGIGHQDVVDHHQFEGLLVRKAQASTQEQPSGVRLEVREVRNPESFASLVGLGIAEQLERRMPFRRVIKRSMERIVANKEVVGARIAVAGRLGGADMARREWIQEGSLPRNTLRSDIDFSLQEAYTTYGVIGIKGWIYKGQKLE